MLNKKELKKVEDKINLLEQNICPDCGNDWMTRDMDDDDIRTCLDCDSVFDLNKLVRILRTGRNW